MPMNSDDLAAIRARCEAAIGANDVWARSGLLADALEIIPALLAEVERLMEDVDALHRECARLYEIEDEHRKCPL